MYFHSINMNKIQNGAIHNVINRRERPGLFLEITMIFGGLVGRLIHKIMTLIKYRKYTLSKNITNMKQALPIKVSTMSFLILEISFYPQQAVSSISCFLSYIICTVLEQYQFPLEGGIFYIKTMTHQRYQTQLYIYSKAIKNAFPILKALL